MKRATILLLPVGFLCIVASSVLRPQAAVPSVNEILAKYVTALGGRDAISKLNSRISKGTLQVVGIEEWGTAESYSKAPNKYCSLITVPGFGELRRGFDGRSGWLKRPDTGITDLTGQELSSMQRASDFYQAIDLANLYPKLTLKGQEVVSGYPAYVLEADPGDGSVRRMYFDVASGLMVRSDEELDTRLGRSNAQTYLEDYRKVDGVQQPFSIRQVSGNTTFIIHLTEVRANQPVDDAIFVKPVK